MDVSKNMGVYPQIIHFNRRVFYYFHHPFWGFSPYFWVDTHMFMLISFHVCAEWLFDELSLGSPK